MSGTPATESLIRPEDAHLLPLEKGARALCQMRGQDPDFKLRLPHPDGLAGVFVVRSAWLFAAEDMLGLSMVLAALRITADPAANTH